MINELLKEIFEINVNRRIELNLINEKLNSIYIYIFFIIIIDIEFKSKLLSQSLKSICKSIEKDTNEHSCI